MSGYQGGQLLVSAGGVLLAVDPSGSDGSYDRKTEKLALANGSLNNNVDFYDGDATCAPKLSMPLSAASAALLATCGVGSTLTAPSPITILYNYPGFGKSYTLCLLSKATISVKRNAPWMVAMEFMSTATPTVTSGATGSPAAQTFFYFRDTTAATTLGTSGVVDINEITIVIDFNLTPDYGIRTDGLALPTSIDPGGTDVSGTIKKRKLSNADFTKFIAACRTPGDLLFGATQFCVASSPLALTITAHNAIYTSESMDQALKQKTGESFNFECHSPDGSNMLALAVA